MQIQSFGPTRGIAVGGEPVGLVATLRNAGAAATDAGRTVAHLYCPAGLEFTEGDPAAKLDAVQPNGSLTLRWRVTPTTPDGPLVAALSLETPGQPPDVRVIAIPHMTDALSPNRSYILKQAAARAGDDTAVIENSRVRARVFVPDTASPILALAARVGPGWRHVAVAVPLAEVLSAEGGQEPWWERFRVDEMHAVNGKGVATVALSGGFGLRWRATIELALRTDSGVLDVSLRASPLRATKLSGLRLMPLLAGDGSFGANVAETLDAEPTGPNILAAVRGENITVGQVWPGDPLMADWTTTPMTTVAGADYRVLGGEMRTSTAATGLKPGAVVGARVRIFALAPSLTVADARKVALPSAARPKTARSARAPSQATRPLR